MFDWTDPGAREIKTVSCGVATIVQGHSCQRTLLSKGQFSKQTFVQGDFFPRIISLTKLNLLILFFSPHITHLYGESL